MSSFTSSKNFRDRLITGVVLSIVVVLTLLTTNAVVFRWLFAFAGAMAFLEFAPTIQKKILWGEIKDDRCYLVELMIISFGVLAVLFYLNRLEIILIILTSIVNDTMAYFTGNLLHDKFFKRHPFPKTSPKKSWEGIIGGWIFTVISLFSLGAIIGIKINPWLIVLAPIAAIAGDYLESFVKRSLGFKDSNEAILENQTPILSKLELAVRGHGGYADRIDSWTAVACLILIVKLFEQQ